ncbi:uncharacterized protein LOC107979438 isoform X1 [Cricetulus griseus]|uniref:Uncharacterized protein LOC107979438 isoform X1 n=1 Tax=Cricetulus griseus TaxID=10029 RepID=A0A9J7F5Q8_CRIGR|nr:uncharacterized protein LOC107979438 isoform X1 [Cricetulus griseus]XP_027251739.1 uncharacterized protein LOC107979438 isoform X1 [Cricetulus griseus]XP_027251740.1 uncharacterized protein LOC107979438 isoform X1 [Cricetulus griseus]
MITASAKQDQQDGSLVLKLNMDFKIVRTAYVAITYIDTWPALQCICGLVPSKGASFMYLFIHSPMKSMNSRLSERSCLKEVVNRTKGWSQFQPRRKWRRAIFNKGEMKATGIPEECSKPFPHSCPVLTSWDELAINGQEGIGELLQDAFLRWRNNKGIAMEKNVWMKETPIKTVTPPSEDCFHICDSEGNCGSYNAMKHVDFCNYVNMVGRISSSVGVGSCSVEYIAN